MITMRASRSRCRAFLIALVIASGCQKPGPQKIGFVVTTLANPYFVTMTNAARAEIKSDPGFELVVQAPETAVDAARQLDLVDNLIAQKVSAICIVPADSKGILPAITKANAANIPVLILDNRIDKDEATKQHVQTLTFVGSDNFAGGKLAGEFVVKKLTGGGEVALLEGVSGVDAAIQRKAGFMAALSAASQIHVVASQPADWDREKGLNVAQNIIQAHPRLKAIFAANDEMALGAVQAVHAARKDHQILVVGFDAIKDALVAIQKGDMDATVAQLPAEVGRLGTKYAVDAANHKPVPVNVPTDVKLVTADNVKSIQ